MLIYLIEDDPDWQSYYQDLLTPAHALKIFPDAITAIAAIDETPPAAIILDLLLVGQSGAALLAELQSYPDTAAIPVALVSSVNITDALADYGVSAVFNKATFSPEELLSWISAQQP